MPAFVVSPNGSASVTLVGVAGSGEAKFYFDNAMLEALGDC
jgi:hypothetical protein